MVPLAEEASGNESRVAYQQTVTNTFAVIVLVSNACDERGQKAFDSIEGLKLEIFRGLLSWRQEPADEFGEIVYSGGQVIYLDDARLAFQFEFSFETYLDLSDTWQEWTSMSSDLSRAQTSGLTVLNRRPRRISRTTKLKQL